MSRRKGGIGKPTRKSAKKLTAIAKMVEEPVSLPSVSLVRKKEGVIPSEQLRFLRHMRPAYLRTLLSKLLLVGEGKSRLSL